MSSDDPILTNLPPSSSTPPRPFHIRPFQPSDLPQVKSIFANAQEEYGNSRDYVQYAFSHDLSDITANYITPPLSCFWCAIDGPPSPPSPSSTVLGIVGLRPLSIGDKAYFEECLSPPPSIPAVPFDPLLTLELNRMAVLPSARRQGIAAALISQCITFTREQGQQAIHLSTLITMGQACQFYKSQGFIQYRTDRQNWMEDEKIGTEEMRRIYRERGERKEDQTKLFIDVSEVPQDEAVHLEHRQRGIYYHTHFYLLVNPTRDKS